MQIKRLLIILCAVVTVTFGALAPAHTRTGAARKDFYVTVAAGAHDRRDSIVSFEAPAGLKGRAYGLRDDRGQVVPLQVDAARRRATFVLPELKAGATRKYRVVELKTPKAAAQPQEVWVDDEGKRLVVREGVEAVIGFQTKPELPEGVKPVFARAGYIHPIYTPSGTLVTDDYPSDHYHHHGVWAAWTKTEFEGRHPDFWNVADGTGRIDFVGLGATWKGPVHGGFTSRQRYVDVKATPEKAALEEEWEVTVYRHVSGAKSYTVFDLVSTQQTSGSSPLKLEEYRYGGVGVRGHREWKDKTKVF